MSKKVWLTQDIETTTGEDCALCASDGRGQYGDACRGKDSSDGNIYCKTVKQADGTYPPCPLDDHQIIIIATSYRSA